MNVALDLGTSGFRMLKQDARRLRGRKTPAYYLAVPAESAQRRLLERVCVPFSICANSFVVLGQHAVELSQALQWPLIPVLPGGRLPEDDPVGRQIAAILIEALIPRRGLRAGRAGLIVPGNPRLPTDADDPLLGFVRRLLALWGHHPVLVHSGTASALAELDDQGFNGLGFSVGAASAALSAMVDGTPAGEWTVQGGCDEIDAVYSRERADFLFDSSGNRYLNVAAAARWRMTAPVDLMRPRNTNEELLQRLCREWVTGVFQTIAQEIRETGWTTRSPIAPTLVVSGGPARMTGFDSLVYDALRRMGFPIAVQEVRLGRPSEFTQARGCLVALQLNRVVEMCSA